MKSTISQDLPSVNTSDFGQSRLITNGKCVVLISGNDDYIIVHGVYTDSQGGERKAGDSPYIENVRSWPSYDGTVTLSNS